MGTKHEEAVNLVWRAKARREVDIFNFGRLLQLLASEPISTPGKPYLMAKNSYPFLPNNCEGGVRSLVIAPTSKEILGENRETSNYSYEGWCSLV